MFINWLDKLKFYLEQLFYKQNICRAITEELSLLSVLANNYYRI